MPANAFQLKIEGLDVSPASVDVGELAKVLQALRGALGAIAKSDKRRGEDEEDEEDNVLLSLVAIEGGSDTLTFNASPRAIEHAGRLTKAISLNRLGSLPKSTHPFLRTIWKTTFDNGWTACRFLANGSAISSAVISEDNELFPQADRYRGRTTIFGECIRAGGDVQRTALVRLFDGKKKTIRLKSQQLAEALGHRLYQTVGLDGEAFWSIENDELLEFRADTLSEFCERDGGSDKPRTVLQAFEALSHAAGKRWDNVDPESFVNEQRRD